MDRGVWKGVILEACDHLHAWTLGEAVNSGLRVVKTSCRKREEFETSCLHHVTAKRTRPVSPLMRISQPCSHSHETMAQTEIKLTKTTQFRLDPCDFKHAQRELSLVLQTHANQASDWNASRIRQNQYGKSMSSSRSRCGLRQLRPQLMIAKPRRRTLYLIKCDASSKCLACMRRAIWLLHVFIGEWATVRPRQVFTQWPNFQLRPDRRIS